MPDRDLTPGLLGMLCAQNSMYWARAHAADDVLKAVPRLIAMARRTEEYRAELGVTRNNLVRTFDDKSSAKELPTSKLAQLVAEELDSADEAVARITDLERRLAEAKGLADDLIRQLESESRCLQSHRDRRAALDATQPEPEQG